MIKHVRTNLKSDRLNATLYLRKDIAGRLEPHDRAKLQQVITNTKGIEGRSLTFRLKTPMLAEGKTYLSIRGKGITPFLDKGPELPEHRGGGYVARPFVIDDTGVIGIGEPTPSPEGTNSKTRVERETNTAWSITDATDLPLGYFFYEGLSYKGDSVGGNLYLMEAATDKRLFKDYFHPTALRYLEDGDSSSNWYMQLSHEPFRGFGEVMALMHKVYKQGHGYPHPDNVGLLGQGRVVIRDLDTATHLLGLPPRKVFAHILHDLARVVSDFNEQHRYDQGEGEPWGFYSARDLVAPFFEGYFKTRLPGHFNPYSISQPFNRLIKDGVSFNAFEWAKRVTDDEAQLVCRHIIETAVPALA